MSERPSRVRVLIRMTTIQTRFRADRLETEWGPFAAVVQPRIDPAAEAPIAIQPS